ncbi:hypothetical protein CEE45_11795 [Candidatus Heimdallarchaeota archaeon B3_Heim]|nr:MAG: hypothetical protein CEE45_11795 [Candidatus Heimdallarchaeota archaeon B3_Heim]
MSLRGNLVDRELEKLKKIFPDLQRKDFLQLKNKNKCVQLSFITTGKYACGHFDILIEFPYNYPVGSPKVWVQKPKILKNTPHVYGWDEDGHASICYLRPKKDWRLNFSSYETALLVEIWLRTYCRWTKTNVWDWPEAGVIDHIF